MNDRQSPQMDAEQAAQFANVQIGPPAASGQTYNQDGQPVEEPAFRGEQLVGMLLALIFGMLADRRGSHWKLSDNETEQLAKTGGALMDHYMPQGSGPGAAFALCLGVALVPRAVVEVALIKERREQAAREDEARRAAEAAETGGGEGVASGD